MLAAIAAIIALVLIFDTRSRMKSLERRLNLLEQAPRVATPPGEPSKAADSPLVTEPEPEPPVVVPEEIPQPVTVIVEPAATLVVAAETVTIEAPVPPPPPPAKPGISFSFEDLFGRRLPIWAGGITLAIAGVFIVKYAIDAGLLTPWVRILSGFLFGTGLVAAAEAAMRNEDKVRDARVRQALSGAGIATLYATILMASNAYGLIGPLAAFILMALVTAGALGLSLRFGAPSALLGLAGGLATPALVGSLQPDIPLLSVYLALTIGGLVAVSRMQRWMWLGLSALLGGAGWSLWMIAASGALDTMASLSIGGLVMLLAIALPLFAFEGPRSKLFRIAAALVGALQLAMLVAIGGFGLLNWGLFGLIAAAGQWLAWREDGLKIVPTIGLALSALLLAVWPSPALGDFALVALALAIVHGGPLLARLWTSADGMQRSVELSALALASLFVPMIHFYRTDGSTDGGFAALALAASVVTGAGMALGWRTAERKLDLRFIVLTSAASLLLFAAWWLALPWWTLPLGAAAIAVALLFFGAIADDRRIELVGAVFGASTIHLLAFSSAAPFAEWQRMIGWAEPGIDWHAVLRWTGVTAMAGIYAIRSRYVPARMIAQIAAALFAYGAIAQILPAALLPLVPAIGLLALAGGTMRLGWPKLAPAAAIALGLAALWAAEPALFWMGYGLMSLAGIPMNVDVETLRGAVLLKQLLVPAMLVGAGLWLVRGQLPRVTALATAAVAGLAAAIAVHCFYRIGFASAFGTDFAETGLGERLVWAGALIGAGAAIWRIAPERDIARRAALLLVLAGFAHTLYYTLLLHNPLWADQHVGGLPVLNLLLPAFGLVPVAIWVLRRIVPDQVARFERPVQLLNMALVAGFAYSSLRQVFHGTSLTEVGIGDTESILVSILAIALAIGFLLWGIRSKQRDWRIASLVLMISAVAKVFLVDASGLEGLLRIGSFVALGFSLIGIGWLYSRQLGSAKDQPVGAAAPIKR